MIEARKLAAIVVADVVGYSRLTGTDEDRTLARLRALRSDLIDPTIAVHHGRIVKRTGDGSIIEFRSVVDAVRCAIDVQTGMVERNAGLPPEKRIEFRIGIHLGDVVEETDGDLMGDGVNIAARLEGICEPGGICLSEDAYRQVKSRLDLSVSDLGQTELKNIAEPIRVYSLDVRQADKEKPALTSAREKSTRQRHSMVVLPFANIGADPDLEYFVDGITESLTTDLSRRRRAVVTARNTALAYKGKSIDVKTIGRDLNVYYVLEGSVQRSGNRVRVNVQLIDAETGNHLWADRFDKPSADLFDMQDEIVARLAGSLTDQLSAAEARRAEQVATPDSMDLYFQGVASLAKGTTPANVEKTRSFLYRALTVDPNNVDALILSAVVDVVESVVFFMKDPVESLQAAEAKSTRAVSLVPDHARAHMVLGVAYILTKRAARGIAECEYALELDSSLATAHANIGWGKIYVGRAEETESHVLEALRLSPRDSVAFGWMTIAGTAKLQLGHWEHAVAWFQRAIEANRSYSATYFALASGLAHLGRLDEAQSAVKAGLALQPDFSLSRARAAWTVTSDNPVYLAGMERILEGMAKAGAPQQ
jgi:TolB-like protein/class 3 adenylate cyclase